MARQRQLRGDRRRPDRPGVDGRRQEVQDRVRPQVQSQGRARRKELYVSGAKLGKQAAALGKHKVRVR
jgi:hypothetical protein